MESRKLENNTYLERRDNDSIAIRLHNTDIVTLHKDDTVTLSSGGWLTMTTKNRISNYAPGIRIESDQGVWQVVILETAMLCDECRAQQGQPHEPYCEPHRIMFGRDDRPITYSERTAYHLGTVYPFADGFTYDLNTGFATDETMDLVYEQQRRNAADQITLSRIRDFINGYTQPHVLAHVAQVLMDGDLAGDCWFCSMVDTDTGENWGDSSGDSGHLWAHLDEDYYVPSLAIHATRERGYGNPDVVLSMMAHDWLAGRHGRTDLFADDLSNYLKRRLLVGAHSKRSPGARTPSGYYGVVR